MPAAFTWGAFTFLVSPSQEETWSSDKARSLLLCDMCPVVLLLVDIKFSSSLVLMDDVDDPRIC